MITSTTAREFVRNFARLRQAATDTTGSLSDREGRACVFRAQEGGPTLSRKLTGRRGFPVYRRNVLEPIKTVTP